ncbi:Aste57867_7948 [Aphanomyces stellatus]|uniref:Aste57867_7948 protein n=1 Tax=Aphanomyces stellatus TaxID=120398 RepID=A0A485KJ19_9STRA|nr:hypothetical protein As57867_007918 [Aphanomyces stellatus]VFT84841.1 Aste57867_7948 [Aphanomyces stellatus]
MLPPSLQLLLSWRVVLASQSPRRLDLLTALGLKFDVIPSTFEENLDKSLFPTPEAYVMENAKQKAIEVRQRLQIQGECPELIIGCDTVDEDDAFRMLSSLSDSKHHVFSGVALVLPSSNVVHVFCESTAVQFLNLDAATIRAYIATGEPMDKAGSYGLQGRAKAFVSSVDGCPNNVIGFPVDRFCVEVAPFLT